MFFDKRKEVLRVERFHQHDVGFEQKCAVAVGTRSHVIQGAGDKMSASPARGAREGLDHLHSHSSEHRRRRFVGGEGAMDPLGSPRGAGGVEHDVAGEGRGIGGSGKRFDIRPGAEAGDGSANAESRAFRDSLRQSPGEFGKTHVGNECARLGVLHHVARFFQVPAPTQGRQPSARPRAAAIDGIVFRRIGQERYDRVPDTDSFGVQRAGKAVARRLHVPVVHDLCHLRTIVALGAAVNAALNRIPRGTS